MSRSRSEVLKPTGLVLALLVGACHAAAPEEAPPALLVHTALVTKGTLVSTLEVAGVLETLPGRDVKLGALTAGRLAEVRVAEGDRVAAGQVLARLDALPLGDAVRQGQAQVAQGRAQLSSAEARHARAEKAFALGVAARQEVEDAQLSLEGAKAQLAGAQAQLSTAQNQLARAELRAPFAGVVAKVLAAAGEVVDAGKPLVELSNADFLELRAGVPPADAARLRAGLSATLHVEGAAGPGVSARVIAISPQVDPATGTVLVRLRAKNLDGALREGAVARGRIELATRSGVLLVPVSALVSAPGGDGLFVDRVHEGKTERRPLETGLRDAHAVEVLSGLAEGDAVLIDNLYALPEGTPVTVAPAAATPPAQPARSPAPTAPTGPGAPQ